MGALAVVVLVMVGAVASMLWVLVVVRGALLFLQMPLSLYSRALLLLLSLLL